MIILILTLYAGALSGGDSVSLAIAEFSSKDKCIAAGEAAVKKFDTPMKTGKYICVEK